MDEKSDLVSNISNFIMIQWPGVKLTKWQDMDLEKSNKYTYQSDPIKDSKSALVEQDAEVLKQLKAQNNRRLRLIGFSWGGLRALMAYLHLSDEDRQGISLSLEILSSQDMLLRSIKI